MVSASAALLARTRDLRDTVTTSFRIVAFSRRSARRLPFAHNVAVTIRIDERIDDLYKGPLGDFTASRNALAKTLTREEAGRIRALRKPTLVAWAVNQLYWRASKTYERLLDRGARLRKAQIAALSGKSDEIGRASCRERVLLSVVAVLLKK